MLGSVVQLHLLRSETDYYANLDNIDSLKRRSGGSTVVVRDEICMINFLLQNGGYL